MQCEICGAEIQEKAIKVTIDGSELNVCGRCSHYGTPVRSQTPVSRKNTPIARKIVGRAPRPRRDPFKELNNELVDGYEEIIKHARESRGWTHQQLAAKIKEKESLIKKIERGEIMPEDPVRKKMERILKVDLTERIGNDEWTGDSLNSGTTLGDIVTIKKK